MSNIEASIHPTPAAGSQYSSLGICLGATTIGYVCLSSEQGEIKVTQAGRRPHGGSALHTLQNLLDELRVVPGTKVAVTGRKSRHSVNFSSISEPETLEQAYAHVQGRYGAVDAIVSAGGETVMVYPLNQRGQIITVSTGNKCASGTGEFYLQQIRRMDLGLEEAAEAAALDQPYLVAGRCSVFCKSDCTHALNKGTPKGQVVAGLAKMMAQKILDLTKQQSVHRIMVVGGCAQNEALLHFLREAGSEVIVPQEAGYFEALGAALWAIQDDKASRFVSGQALTREIHSSFERLAPLSQFIDKVSFKSMATAKAVPGDRLILGLDVGSTTTKAVLIRQQDNAMVASIYLRTNGDPVKASRECYAALRGQVPDSVEIIGLGVTGSGRQIAGLHALTDGVINEIIAHATAAVYFDPEVQTILEIGGQDAKYTYITNRVPSDYAMNEACSAGTGSFLEEAARESLGIPTVEIGERALQGDGPANFSDQCAAFISSDIKTAIQEGIGTDDILAGLVYSICQNYTNRVKGNRPVGQKVFMQGGVCYNRAVPVAMAALTGKEIIVPPEPGLMGAFGVALEIKDRLRLGLMSEERYDLGQLMEREVSYGRSFVCQGGADRCDRKCSIRMIGVNGNSYPFGGACNKYANIHNRQEISTRDLDLVALREELVFDRFARRDNLRTPGRRAVGVNKSLLTNTLYPLYYHFFTQLGFDILISSEKRVEGMERRGAPFCYPVEISHGHLAHLVSLNPDIYFLPHVKAMPGQEEDGERITCPFVQGEPYYLRTTFADLLDDKQVLAPVLDFANGFAGMEGQFIAIGQELGVSSQDAARAFAHAKEQMQACLTEMQRIGQDVLSELERDPQRMAVILFGRPYNALTTDANMGIPHKLASRAVRVMPLDFLPLAEQDSIASMYWATGQAILKAAKMVEEHPQLFGVYITNFSCGPDSFLLSFFRYTMGSKPSLTLELDSHTADAGIDTRIEAFLDIVASYRTLGLANNPKTSAPSMPEVIMENGRAMVKAVDGRTYALTDARVKVVIPPLGEANSFLAAGFQAAGIRAVALPAPGEDDLKRGKAYASCKECLPLMLTVGGLLNYLDRDQDAKHEQIVYFMPTTNGPCRFGQYNVLIKQILETLGITNVSLLSLNSDNGYAGMNMTFLLRVWVGILLADVMEDIYSALLVLAKDQERALETLHKVNQRVVASLAQDSWAALRKCLKGVVRELNGVSLRGRFEDQPKVGLLGEIYVRRDGFSRRYLVERMADRGIITMTAPYSEWIYYCDYLVQEGLGEPLGWLEKQKGAAVNAGKRWIDHLVKDVFSDCQLYHPHFIDIYSQINTVKHRISPELTGETILTASSAVVEIVDHVHGVISIGPFACMPSRMCEAMIPKLLERDKPANTQRPELLNLILEQMQQLPFLAIESDGSVLPPLVEAKLETFAMQVNRMHGIMESVKQSSN